MIDPRSNIDEHLHRQLQQILDNAINTMEFPGVQAGIVLQDGRHWIDAAGTTNYLRNQFVQANNLFRIASGTKLYTAIIIMHYIEMGALHLSDPNLTILFFLTAMNIVLTKPRGLH